MGKRQCRRHGLAALAVGVAVSGFTAACGGDHEPLGSGAVATATPGAHRPQRTSPPPSSGSAEDREAVRFAPRVVAHASKARVHSSLLMAILLNESNKPHDPALERAWQKLKPDAAFGIANMHKAAFDEAKRGRDFAARQWEELPDDPDLAIESAAWYLHDLAGHLPAKWRTPYTKDELLALGYNAGPGNMRAFARGAKLGQEARSYLERLRGNWPAAQDAVRHLR
ncbi:transglycosylase SLT domain-containing protein [Microbispora sp. H10670]|uniref:transglycosylase SLT domain-containing protein n=1 Tax=unclassified Microbispora TaxID=2614687 RepID=UPI0016017212|nr:MULTISPECIES: transglycosylase SLT domain-containing protein [unclassified Microbispora]